MKSIVKLRLLKMKNILFVFLLIGSLKSFSQVDRFEPVYKTKRLSDSDWTMTTITGGRITFQEGTQVELDKNGRVISGYIRGSWTMTTVAGGRITFQEGFVRWTRDGVETGQLDGDWTITTKSNNRITFKDKHVVSFDKDGVWQGTLSGKWTCTTCDGSRITFKNYIIFSKCGVASGHLSGAWTIGGRNYRDGQRVYFYE